MMALAGLLLVAAAAATGTRPHILFVVVDDLGWDDLGFRNGGQIKTPVIDTLASEGIVLTHMYTMPVCSPARTSMNTGRYPMRFGLQHQVIWAGTQAGLPLNETTLANRLSEDGGYACHAIGKWHMGFYSWQHTPTWRGYQSFLGFYGGGEDYFAHTAGAGSESPGPKLSSGFDFRFDNGADCGSDCSIVLQNATGKYSTTLFAERGVQVVEEHDFGSLQPLFVYLAFQAVHAPDQVPPSYMEPYATTIQNPTRRTFAGMLAAVDEGVGNVTAALAAATTSAADTAPANNRNNGNIITVLTTDNGGPSDQGPGTSCPVMSYCKGTGTSNFPLRGGKHTLFEGGVRGVALIHAPGLLQGKTNYSSIFSIADFFPTLLSAAGISEMRNAASTYNGDAHAISAGRSVRSTGRDQMQFALDGLSHWAALQGSSSIAATSTQGLQPPTPVRREVWIQSDPLQAEWNKEVGDAPHAALRIDAYKLIVGPPGCPDSIVPPYRLAAEEPESPTQPSAKCQAELNSWCNVQANCPGPNSNATRWHSHCGPAINPPQQFYARFDGPEPNQWRCYGASSLSPDHSHFNKNSSCYCSRGAELGRLLAECGGKHPPPLPPPSPPSPSPSGASCSRRPGSSVLLFDVVADPSESHDLASQMPDMVASMLRRLGELNATLGPLQYPLNDPKANPTLHDGVWTPWVASPTAPMPTATEFVSRVGRSEGGACKGCFNMSRHHVFHGFDLPGGLLQIPENNTPAEGYGFCIGACCNATGCAAWATGPSETPAGRRSACLFGKQCCWLKSIKAVNTTRYPMLNSTYAASGVCMQPPPPPPPPTPPPHHDMQIMHGHQE